MSVPFSHSLHLSSAIEEPMVPQKQGIVSILGEAETERSSVPFKACAGGASLRRTLSADMSSKKWLNQQGFSSLKKIASSNLIFTINDSSSEEGEGEDEKPGQFDIWSSIVSQKEESPLISPPYIHPLIKRSASCLSEKSLEICTESLGSETGSDSFSASYPPSESGGEIMEEEEEEEEENPPHQLPASFNEEEPRILKYNNYVDVVGRKPAAAAAEYRSFPPPIPSLSRKDGAAVVRMRTHRDNGRVVLEAVSVASQNNFLAQRQDGRLVLTFANTKTESSSEVEEEEKEEEELEEVFDESFEEEDTRSEIDAEEEETEEHRWCEMEGPKLIPSGAMNVHRLAVMTNKPIWLANRNPTWPKNFEQIVQFGEEKEEITTTPPPPPLALAQSLPPRPPVSRPIPSQAPSTVAAAATAASLNGYNHYWRKSTNHQPMSKTAAAAAATADQVLINPLAQQSPPVKNLMPNDHHQQLRLVVPFSKGCKELMRSLLIWKPYCIAT